MTDEGGSPSRYCTVLIGAGTSTVLVLVRSALIEQLPPAGDVVRYSYEYGHEQLLMSRTESSSLAGAQ